MRFDEFDLSDDILDALEAMKFEECTPIQEQTIPIILNGDDLVACAQTGTGKTAAYLLPVIDMISEGGYPLDAINCIVMSPTRELAQQIDRQMEGFAYYLPVNSLAVYGGTGGADFTRQQHGLKEGVDVVIATPGRLLDHIQMGYVDLSRVSFFILDEADRMLDMGFYDDIMRIAKLLPEKRQTLLFSATMPAKTRKLAQEILRNPKRVDIAVSRPTEKIDQSAYVCTERQKLPILKYLLREVRSQRVIVFAASKQNVKDLTRELRRSKIKAAEMHSDLDQEQRNEVMLGFRAGKIDVLVATDILARGIDIDDISMVVNYDVPREAEDYVHRIGRTARANADGVAVTLVSERDQAPFGKIERFLGYEVVKRPHLEGIGEAPAYNPDRRSGARGNSRRGNDRKSSGANRRNSKGRNDSGARETRPADEQSTEAKASTGSEPKNANRRDKRTYRRHGGRNRNNGNKKNDNALKNSQNGTK